MNGNGNHVSKGANESNGSTSNIIQSSSYQFVTHKKKSGTLILTDSALTFYPAKATIDIAEDTAKDTSKDTAKDNASDNDNDDAKDDASNKAKDDATNNATNGLETVTAPMKFEYKWLIIQKHQVSPSSHPRYLLKIILHPSDTNPDTITTNTRQGKKSSSLTYEFQGRKELEKIRTDISSRLTHSRRVQALNSEQHSIENRKRKLDSMAPHDQTDITANPTTSSIHIARDTTSASEMVLAASSASVLKGGAGMSSQEMTASNFTSLNPYEQSVTCSSILASDRNIRTQHSLLTSNLISNSNSTNEQDFWSTHSRKESNQAAKIHGFVSKGIPSSMKSSLDIQISGNVSKPIKLGVEEMRQIFIMYPAVHDAYEEKVPLELSEEQFWRKYLESEYFHRDRGRVGSSAKTVGVSLNPEESKKKEEEDVDGGKKEREEESQHQQQKEREETARMGAASSNDIFSRKEIELQKRIRSRLDGSNHDAGGNAIAMAAGVQRMAVGQFDLLATANTERGSKLLLNSNDLHPFDDRGRKVIEKYNRHWAMVLNPDDASAGCDLTALAKKSALHALEDDDDAKVNGGFGKEMKRLVGFANADHDHVDHVKGMGRMNGEERDDDDGASEPVLFEELKLRNIDAYAGKNIGVGTNTQDEDPHEMSKTDLMYSQFAMEQIKKLVAPLIDSKRSEGSHQGSLHSTHCVEHAFPTPKFGCNLLLALTKHMVLDSMTEMDTAKMTKSLPEDFRKRLTSYTRRSNELLRHFFALRHVMEQEKKVTGNGGGSSSTGTSSSSSSSKSSQKLKRIVQGMEGVYRELEGMRKDLPQIELGEQMRKMCLPIMDQLDWAFKLNRDISRSGGGFVDIQD